MMVQQCFFFSEKQQETILNFSSDSLIVTEYGILKNIKFVEWSKRF